MRARHDARKDPTTAVGSKAFLNRLIARPSRSRRPSIIVSIAPRGRIRQLEIASTVRVVVVRVDHGSDL